MNSNFSNDYDVVVIGLGYVGLTLAASFSKSGLSVLGVEKRKEVVEAVKAGKAHFYEPGLDELLSSQLKAGNLNVVHDLTECPGFSADYFVITVGTPLGPDGSCNLEYCAPVDDQVRCKGVIGTV